MKNKFIFLLTLLTIYNLKPFSQEGKFSNYIIEKNNSSYWFISEDNSKALEMNEFMINMKSEFKINPDIKYKLKETRKDNLGYTHYRYFQTYKDVEISNSEMFLHEKNGKIQSANGYIYSIRNIDIIPAISPTEAIEYLNNYSKLHENKDTKLELKYNKLLLVQNRENNKILLAHSIEVQSKNPFDKYEIHINAMNNNVIDKISLIHSTDSTGTANTYYQGTQNITTNFNGTDFKMNQIIRPISLKNLNNEYDLTNVTEVIDNDNNWIERKKFIDSLQIISVNNNFWNDEVGDVSDFYLVIKDINGLILFTSDENKNSSLPCQVYSRFELIAASYTIELWEKDSITNDDFGISFTINNDTNNQPITNGLYNFIVHKSGHIDPALDIYWGVEKTYDYYLNKHSRNSIDDDGMQILAYSNLGLGFNNAYWDGNSINIGNGDGYLYDYLSSIDVIGHEITHGVTQHSANLIYQGESGALNESFSDIFGKLIEYYSTNTNNWLIGDKVTKSKPFMRSMMDPNSAEDPDTYKGLYWKNTSAIADNGGVHSNSGVQNYWFYLLVQGDSGINDNGDYYNITPISVQDAEKIVYRNLTEYLNSNSQYIDAKIGSSQAAADLFGNNSQQYWSVVNAWCAVGIGKCNNNYCKDTAIFTANYDVFEDGSMHQNYLNNTDCYWLIQPTNADSIYLFFTSFYIENIYDSVIVYDGDNTNSPILATLTGYIFPDTIHSTGNKMLVRFKTNDSITTSGWNAFYYTSNLLNNYPYCPNNNNLIGNTGNITFYDNENQYLNNTNCEWIIQPSNGSNVIIDFDYLYTEESYDYVHLYAGNSTSSPLIGSYSGYIPPSTIYTNSNIVLVNFKSDTYINEYGFGLNYYTQNDIDISYCNSTTTFNYQSVTFNDGSDNNIYGNYSDCKWLIQPTNYDSIVLNFTSFNTESNADYVKVYKGNNTSSPLLGTFSGSNIPQQISVKSNQMLVHFTSNSDVRFDGWTANYNAYKTSNVGQNELEYNRINIFPNPNSGKFTIKSDFDENSNYNISDISGKIIIQNRLLQKGENIIDIQEYDNGIYFISVIDNNKATYTYKIIKD